MQTTFVHALRSLRNGVRPELEVAWLLAIARNVCRERWRTTYRVRAFELAPDADRLDDVAAPPAVRRDELLGLDDALARLTDQQRRAVLLRDWRGLTYAEIAERLALTEAAVETLLFRARHALATELEHGPRERGLRHRLRTLLMPVQWFWRAGAGGKLAAGTAAVSLAVVVGSAAPPSSVARPTPVVAAHAPTSIGHAARVPTTHPRPAVRHERVHATHRAPAVARTTGAVAPRPPGAPEPTETTPVAAAPVPAGADASAATGTATVPAATVSPPVTLQTPGVELPQPLPSVPALTVQTPAIQATAPTVTALAAVPPLPPLLP